jgi:hypothetical protein
MGRGGERERWKGGGREERRRRSVLCTLSVVTVNTDREYRDMKKKNSGKKV